MLVNCLNSHAQPFHFSFDSLSEDVVVIHAKFSYCCFHFVPRVGNVAAHKVAVMIFLV